MFGLFKKPSFRDSLLGTLQRSSGAWKGTFPLPGIGEVAIHLAGGRQAPDPECLSLAHGLAEKFPLIEPQIRAGLFEHYGPYREAHDDGEIGESDEPFPHVTDADGILSHAVMEYVFIGPIHGLPGKEPALEIAYRVAWDEEHTVGLRFQDWQVFEVCGSV